MKIAFVDLMFSWPPHGGADVDLYAVIGALQRAGHESRLFAIRHTGSWERGIFEPEALPFAAERIDIGPREFNYRHVPGVLCEAVDAWEPDLVYLGFGLFLKPYVTLALAAYPMVSRYYSYEAACQRSFLQFRDGAPCPKDYFSSPNFCRKCALAGQAADLKRALRPVWTAEFLAAEAHRPEYHGLCVDALRALRAAIVYNTRMREPLLPYVKDVHIVPGGVDTDAFGLAPEPVANGRAGILMTGRCEDPLKGVAVLLEAGERLARTRNDFEIRATLPEDTTGADWFRPLGWSSHGEIKRLYAESAICVVPSLWEEPFGIVAVEAMATGRPVCASRVGGLQDIVLHGETGFVFDRGDSVALAGHLASLLDDPDLRRRMGTAGRARVEAHYTWDAIGREHYAPLLAAIEAER